MKFNHIYNQNQLRDKLSPLALNAKSQSDLLRDKSVCNQDGRVVKALDLSSNGGIPAWVRTPLLVLFFILFLLSTTAPFDQHFQRSYLQIDNASPSLQIDFDYAFEWARSASASTFLDNQKIVNEHARSECSCRRYLTLAEPNR